MNNTLKPNHLAQRIDHQKSAASSLPKPLKDQYSKLTKLTEEIRLLFANGLPDEILKSLTVVKFEEGYLVISVETQTAANHLRYQRKNLINILKEQSLTFNQLKNIDVIVTYPASINDLIEKQGHTKIDYLQPNLSSNNLQSHDKHGFTEITKRTISYTAQHVITDERLKKSLERLCKNN